MKGKTLTLAKKMKRSVERYIELLCFNTFGDQLCFLMPLFEGFA
jgi:hypothetical protein